MIAFIKRILARPNSKYLRMQKECHDQLNRRDTEWQNNVQQNMIAITKARQLAAIARERNALKDEIAKAMRQKKATAPMYHALRALKVEELKVEGRR